MAATRAAVSYRWVVLALAFLSQLGSALALLSVAPLAPLFQPELGLRKMEVGFFSSAAFAGTSVVLLAAGALTDRVGVRRMLLLGHTAAGACLLGMAWAGSFGQALVLTLAAGLGCGTVLPAATKAVADWFPPRLRATAMGIKQSAVPMGGLLTAALLPTVALALGWRVAIALVGVFVIAAGLVCALLYSDPGGPRPAGSTLGVRGNLRHVLRNRALWTLGGVSVLFVTAQQSVGAYLALYLNEVVLPPFIPDEPGRIVAAGGYLALCQAGGVLGRVMWGLAGDRWFAGHRMVALAALGLASALLFVAMACLGVSLPLGLVAALVFGVGLTSIGWNGLYFAAMTEAAGPKHAATGVGLVMTMNQFGTVCGPPLFGLVVDVSGSYPAAWLGLAAISVAGSLLAMLKARNM